MPTFILNAYRYSVEFSAHDGEESDQTEQATDDEAWLGTPSRCLKVHCVELWPE